MQRWWVVVCIMVGLGGCATLSQDECLTADWYQLGQRDGYDGQSRARLAQHYEACSQYGIAPDENAYYRGREQGLQYYCTPRRGFEVGSAGRNYQRVCPPIAEQEFMRGYLLGQELHREQQRLSQLESEIRDLEQRLQTSTDADDRESLRRRIRLLDEELLMLRRLHRQHEQQAVSLGYR